MKKLIKIFMVFALAFSMFACGNDTSKDGDNDAGVKVDEGLLTVDITLDSSFFEGQSEQEIIQAAEQQGILKCVVNEDGSVVYTMTKAKQKELLSDMAQGIDDMITGMLEGEDKVASFVKIEKNDKYNDFKVYIDQTKYSAFDALYKLSLVMSSMYYQMFDGISPDKMEVVVDFIDHETQEVIDHYSYQEYIKENGEE